jgi:hypothetical protein
VVGEAGVNQRTPDISALIQEIVDRSGWVGGNSLAIIVRGTGTRTAEAYEEDHGGAALLHVEYSTEFVNRAPVVAISSPADGSNFVAGQAVSFSGSAIDHGDGDLGASLSWTSSRDGAIGTGASFSRSNLSVGVHTITASVTDSGGLSGQNQVSVTVNPVGAPVTKEVRVAAGSDDAEEGASGTIYLNSSDIELVYDSYANQGNQTVGLRFNGVDVPQGATILNAYVQFKVDETGSGATSLTIYGQSADNAGAFLSSTGNISARPRTTASMAWSPAAWTVVGEAGVNQRTPDISALIQEIVDRSGWVGGNSLAIIVRGTGTRTAEAYEEDRSGAALLHIEYSLD